MSAMSARPCGCDDAAGWICKQHGDEMAASRESAAFETLKRFDERIASEQAQSGTKRTMESVLGYFSTAPPFPPQSTSSIPIDAEVTPLDDAIIKARFSGSKFLSDIEVIAQGVEILRRDYQDARMELRRMRNDRRHVAEVLATFYTAPLSASALQPILDLAVELNPSLKERK